MTELMPDLVENHEAVYAALFAGEFLGNDQLPVDEAALSLSSLWRERTAQRGRDGEFASRIPLITEQVQRTIADHDQAARTSGHADAFFPLGDPDRMLPVVSGITSRVMCLWEKACYRHDYAPLLGREEALAAGRGFLIEGQEIAAHQFPEKSIILEVAAAALRSLPIIMPDSSAVSERHQRDVARVLANTGPRFLADWMGGSFVTNWIDQQVVTPQERSVLLWTLSPAVRRRLLINNSNPLIALQDLRANLALLGNTAAIAQELEWPESEVKQVLSLSITMRLALNYSNTLPKALRTIKKNMAEILTDEKIAEHLGWPQDEVARRFSPTFRRRVAAECLANPLNGIKKHADVIMSRSQRPQT